MPDNNLEYLVRPFTTPGPHGSVIIPSTPRGSRERATLSWGATSAITMPTPVEVNEGVNFEVVCCKEDLTENDRKSEKIRVFQIKEDGTVSDTNFIDYERPISVRLNKKDKNKCFDGLSQVSDTIQAINNDLDQFSDAIHSGTASTSGEHCAATWEFKNKVSGF